MSGQEEQQQQQQQSVGEHRHDDNVERFVDLMMLASVAPPPRGPSLLDYLYYHGVPISVSPFQRAGGDGGGGGVNNPNDIESLAASILNRSLYDRHPVKKVITEEARLEIVDKKFTAAMVEQEKINDVCGIWQEQFEEGEEIKILPCNHAFKADAIMKWLEQEKAECPVCRFSLKSKEVNENQNFDDSDEDEDEDEDEVLNNDPQPAPAVEAAAPAQDNDAIRVNNIASRLVQSVAGRMSGRINHPSVSVPMNQFLQSVRMMSSSSRPREPMRASSGAAAAPNSREAYANAGREVRAEAIQHAADPINNNNNNNYNNYNNNNYNNNNYSIINNNYYYYDAIHNNNNYDNNNYNHDEDVVLNQEQADIEEAIRRSLEQI